MTELERRRFRYHIRHDIIRLSGGRLFIDIDYPVELFILILLFLGIFVLFIVYLFFVFIVVLRDVHGIAEGSYFLVLFRR